MTKINGQIQSIKKLQTNMTSTTQILDQIASKINPNDLTNFIQLFQLALSGTNTESQKTVFQTLSQVQSKPETYLYFLYIFLNPEYDQSIRYITGTTMKSALERNSKQLHFEQGLRNLMKTALLSVNITEDKLKSPQNILISQLAFCFEEVDWQLIYFLVNKIQYNSQVLTLLYTIFEDLKHHRQNYSYFEGAIQTQVIQALFTKVHTLICQTIIKVNLCESQLHLNELKVVTDCLRLIKIITFHLPVKLSQYLITFVKEFIIPVLKQLSVLFSKQQIGAVLAKGNEYVMGNFLLAVFESVNQIAQTKCQYLLENNQFLDQFILYFPITSQQFRKHFLQVCKIWTNTVLELVINDQVDDQNQEEQGTNYHKFKIFNYVEFIIPKILTGFRFTKEDQIHILQEMELEHNPYNMEDSLKNHQQNSDHQQTQYETSHGKAHGSTLRKVSIICIEKLSQRYRVVFWEQTKGLFEKMLLDEGDYKVQQSAIVFVGIVAENCQEQIRKDALPIIGNLMHLKSRLSHDIVLASSLWAIEKLIPAFQSSIETKKFVYELIYKVMSNKEEYGHLAGSKNLMVKEAAVSLLDELLSQETEVDTQIIKIMLECLIFALEAFTGRALFNVFKALSTIFELPEREGIEAQLVSSAIKYICAKWAVSVQKDSIMCPLIQCLSYICQNRKQQFVHYSLEILTQIYPLFRQIERKSLVLRVIDLATAIIVAVKQWPESQTFKNIRDIVSSQEFLSTVNNLILSEEKEVRHFGYGLLSDIVKLKGVSNEKAYQFIQTIAQSMDRSNSTSINNALMCLTDIIDHHRQVGTKFCHEVLQVIVDFVEKFPSSNLPKIYLLNFARMFGRLAHVDMISARDLVAQKKGILKYLAQGLRSQEKSQLTLSAYQGIVLLLISMSDAEVAHMMETKEIEYVVDSFMGYKYNLEFNENMQLIKILFQNMCRLLQLRNISWNQYLSSTVFYPATVNRILQMTN